jgi:hypothetical protein
LPPRTTVFTLIVKLTCWKALMLYVSASTRFTNFFVLHFAFPQRYSNIQQLFKPLLFEYLNLLVARILSFKKRVHPLV